MENTKVLFVEDSPTMRRIIMNSLKTIGFKSIIEAENGADALEKIEDDVGLILTDWNMPEMNGKELAEEVSKIFPETLILFSSGYTEDHIVKSGSIEQGINFLQKPYSIFQLSKRIREIIKGS